MACGSNVVVAAWASATAPKGLPRSSNPGISVFSKTLSITKTGRPTFDRVKITIETGNDDARSDLELTASFQAQNKSICLKPSTSRRPDETCSNGDGATDQNGKDSWGGFTSSEQNFALDPPITSAGDLKTLMIVAKQDSCSLFCDNWDLQRIMVTVLDSSNRLQPVTLLNVGNGRDPNNDDNCIARLKALPQTTGVTYQLSAAHPGHTMSSFGLVPPGRCPD